MSHLANHLSFLPSNEQVSSLAVASPFAYQIWQQDKAQVEAFLGQYPFDKRLDRALIDALVVQFCAYDKAANADVQEASVAKGLRVLRKLLMVRWIWQDALHLVDVVSLTTELSEFANSAICFAKEFVYDGLIQRYGEPMVATKIPKKDEFAIIAMGKLGAGELNLSSDIDLIFVHKGQGDTDISKVGKKSIDTQKFMLNLGRGVIRLLDDNNEHGFVFRVDMRLRPWGDGSPLVITLQALAKYFDHHGRTWERFAWLKARVVNPVSGAFLEEITTLARTFVFRYYVDYSAFSALREMRTLISNQVAQREDLDNVKLGVGGIRDIEFIAQAFALIYGGHYVVLMERTACLEALDALCELGIIEKSTCEDLTSAYQFLRRLEHAIQARHDTQSQRLPVGDELFAIAQALGFASVDELRTVLDTHRAKVSLPFDKLVTARQSLQEDSVIDADKEVTAMAAWLDEPNAERLQAFWSSRLINNLSEEAKNRLMQAYPMIIHALNSHQHNTNFGNVALPRLLDLLEAICRRSIYLVMLSENPNATLNLIPMLSASPWIARELALYPVLLDTLLQKRYQHLPDKAELQAILAQNLLSVTPFDDESYLNAIRLFKKTQVLAVATSDVLDHHPIMKVSDSLTFISEVVLESCLTRAFDELVAKHGYPLDLQGERLTREACGFAVIGYGKLGGIEMSYASDLDVVFLHRVSEQAMTDGEKHPISGMKFATRLVQKLITYLTTQT
ncbi:MAG: bifunctional [glutamate--ammonia ligase]-adenylyl-L-tyrosine phosphorylase/[glutamate--ammonia-ligase] adenylyltransferase, partial [Moraxella sp.]|nr:bifunctional [glutamate--ammonia ligase]-adenylyl-L-tyrosine phosphorylase/[glutamate--ammonia-ligase] adenylyltransferase [Moraxella sp.]